MAGGGSSARAAEADDNQGESVVLEEVNDPNYEPEQEEIEEYAEWLGMDLNEDRNLMWIAREGIKAPLPHPWKPCKAPNGDVYYFDFETGESIWDHPCDLKFRELYKQVKKSKQIDRLAAPPAQPLPPLSSRSIDQEPEEIVGSEHIDDIAFSDDPLKEAEVSNPIIPASIKSLDFNKLIDSAQKVAEIAILADSVRLALEGEGEYGDLTFSEDPRQKIQPLVRPNQVPVIDMASLWGELAPALRCAAEQSEEHSEQALLSTLRDVAEKAAGMVPSDSQSDLSSDFVVSRAERSEDQSCTGLSCAADDQSLLSGYNRPESRLSFNSGCGGGGSKDNEDWNSDTQSQNLASPALQDAQPEFIPPQRTLAQQSDEHLTIQTPKKHQSPTHSPFLHSLEFQEQHGAQAVQSSPKPAGSTSGDEPQLSVEAAQDVLKLLSSAPLAGASSSTATKDGKADAQHHLPAQDVAQEVAILKAEIVRLKKAMVHTNSQPADSSPLHRKPSDKSSVKRRAPKRSTGVLLESRGKVRPSSAGSKALGPVNKRMTSGPKPALCRSAMGEMNGLLSQLQKWSDKQDRVKQGKRSKSSRPGSAQAGYLAANTIKIRQNQAMTANVAAVKPAWRCGSSIAQPAYREHPVRTTTCKSKQATGLKQSKYRHKLHSTIDAQGPKRKVSNRAKTSNASSRTTIFIGAMHHTHNSNLKSGAKKQGRIRVA